MPPDFGDSPDDGFVIIKIPVAVQFNECSTHSMNQLFGSWPVRVTRELHDLVWSEIRKYLLLQRENFLLELPYFWVQVNRLAPSHAPKSGDLML